MKFPGWSLAEYLFQADSFQYQGFVMTGSHLSNTSKVQLIQWFRAFFLSVSDTFFKHRCLDNAAALTYTTLFAVVPMMTVTYSMLSAIPSFQGVGETVQSFIFSHFVPTAGEQIQSYLSSFSQQARKLTGVGIVFLVVTAFMMLRTIDRAINQIWQVDRVRRGITGFLLYWAILSMGPFLIGVGFVLTSYLASLKLIADTTAYLGVDQWLLRLTPMLLSSIVFTLLYLAVPNRRVPFRHALGGALVVAFMLELAKAGFALFITLSPSYHLIYGAFAAVPLFLLWIYLSWILVLFGAVLVRSFALSNQMRNEALPPLLGVLVVLNGFNEQFQKGLSLKLKQLHLSGWNLSLEDWERYTSYLLEQGVVSKNDLGEMILAKDLRHLELNALCQQLPWSLPSDQELVSVATQNKPEWFGQLIDRLKQLNEKQRAVLDCNIDRLFNA